MMRKALAPVFLGLCSMALNAATFIDDGIPVTVNAFPSIVKLQHYVVSQNKELAWNYCTGTMIAKDIVVTAAHCVNKDPEIIHRVSRPGDVRGATVEGIKVKRFFLGKDYDVNNEKLQKLVNLYTPQEFARLSAYEKKQHSDKKSAYSASMSQFDIAFLELESEQTPHGEMASLGCRSSLIPGVEVQIAGYGYKAISGSKKVLTNGNLNYGSNFLSGSLANIGALYKLEKKKGRQLINSGDSGGPLMSKKSAKIIYGIASTKYATETENLASTFANLSSSSATQVYREILTQKDLPKSLEGILKACL